MSVSFVGCGDFSSKIELMIHQNNNNLQYILMIMEILNGDENTHPGKYQNITIQNNHNLNEKKKQIPKEIEE